jgi:hypothetical protein
LRKGLRMRLVSPEMVAACAGGYRAFQLDLQNLL